MMSCMPIRSSKCAVDSALPELAGHIIQTLACKVALCCQLPQAERSVVVTIRRCPVDRQGRAGCHVEIWTLGPPPPDGLQAVRLAGEDVTGRGDVPAMVGQISEPRAVVPHALALDELILGGWRVTLDLRWSAA